MYLRPTPATVDPSVPGSTRRPQISVRPGAKETTRGHAPPPRRSGDSSRTDGARSEGGRAVDAARGESVPLERFERGLPERVVRRERPSEPLAAANPRPHASRPRTAMVVSPVSLTQEEVQPGARPKMPTLLGLGAAMDVPPSHPSGVERVHRHQGAGPAPQSDPAAAKSGVFAPPKADPAASDAASSSGAASPRSPSRRARAAAARADRHEAGSSWRATPATSAGVTSAAATAAAATTAPIPTGVNASPSSPSSAAPERRGFDALARAVEVEVPADIAGSVRLLADFALKLSLGPISRQWVPEVRRSVEALLLTGKHRHETALVALSARLLEVLPDGSPVARHEAEEATACTETSAASEGDAAPDVSVGDAAGVASAAGPDAEASVSPEPSAAEASTGTEHDRVAAASDASDSAAASNGGPDAGALAPEALAPEASQVNGVDGNAVDGAVATNANELAATAAEATPPVDPALAPQLGASPEAASAPVDQPNAPLPDTLPPTTSVPDTLPSDPLLPDASLEDAVLRGTLRERVLHELSRLAGVLAEWPAPAQDLAEEARRRETQVMRQLLEQVDGLRRDQRARLEEQMRLEDLASMSPAAIAEEFDAPLERASELRRVLDAYRQERQRRAPDVANSVGLSLALDELESRCAAFDDCDQEQRDVVRTLRAQRRQALTAVNLLLAERGELEWLEQLEPLAIGERVERLKHWLDAGSEGSY